MSLFNKVEEYIKKQNKDTWRLAMGDDTEEMWDCGLIDFIERATKKKLFSEEEFKERIRGLLK